MINKAKIILNTIHLQTDNYVSLSYKNHLFKIQIKKNNLNEEGHKKNIQSFEICDL